MTTSNTSRRTTYTRQADILANALVSDSPEVIRMGELEPEIRIKIVTARLMGYHPVSVRWTTGEFALMFCEPGTNMPTAEKILEAFYQCRRTNKTFPQGVQS